jgi:molybdopterin-binding protein
MKVSARNQLKGKVKKVTPGAVNSEIIIELPGGLEIASIITKQSAETMSLAVGKTVYAVIKATDVMVGAD